MSSKPFPSVSEIKDIQRQKFIDKIGSSLREHGKATVDFPYWMSGQDVSETLKMFKELGYEAYIRGGSILVRIPS